MTSGTGEPEHSSTEDAFDETVTHTTPLSGEVWAEDPSIHRVPKRLYIAEDDSDGQITQKLVRQGVSVGKGLIAPRVFWPALIVILAVTLVAIFVPEGTSEFFGHAQSWIVANLGWYYMLPSGSS